MKEDLPDAPFDMFPKVLESKDLKPEWHPLFMYQRDERDYAVRFL